MTNEKRFRTILTQVLMALPENRVGKAVIPQISPFLLAHFRSLGELQRTTSTLLGQRVQSTMCIGTADQLVPYIQAELLVGAMDKARAPYCFHTVVGGGHNPYFGLKFDASGSSFNSGGGGIGLFEDPMRTVRSAENQNRPLPGFDTN
jgi:hypothetical protein